MAESCYDDSVPAQAWNFLKLVSKYGYCQDTLGTPGDLIDGQPRDALDPCNDLYILMCFAAAQVAVGSVQILSCLFGKLKKGKVADEGVTGNEDDKTDDASNGGMTILGVLSWIAGIIMLTIYTSAETFGTSLPNASPDGERFYNSFKAAVIMNVTLFAFGLLFILTLAGIFVFRFIFKNERCKTLFIFIFHVIVMGIATSFYGCIAYYGWPYVHGSCLDQIENGYSGPSENTVKLTIDSSWLLTDIDVDGNKTALESDLKTIFEQKWYAGPQAECMVNDDCEELLEVCNLGICGKAASTKDDVPDPVCAKGRDCGKGKTCNAGQCEANAKDMCGSRLDCKANETCETYKEDNKEVSKCKKRVPQLNAYNYEFGQYFYKTACKLNEPSNGVRSGDLEFSCSFQYEADAIQHRINDTYLEEEDDSGAYYFDDALECNLLDLQFRQFQLDMLTLNAFEAEKLAVGDCSAEKAIISTPAPATTEAMPDKTTRAYIDGE